MKVFAYLAAALAVMPGVLAADQTKAAIIYFKDNSTPDHVVQKAKENIVSAGGHITHTYKIIKGFSVTAPANALELVQSWADDNDHKITVEEDEMVDIQ